MWWLSLWMPTVLQVSTLIAFSSSLPHRSSSYAGDIKLPLVMRDRWRRWSEAAHTLPR